MAFKLDAEGLLSGLMEFENKGEAAIWAYAETAALQLQNYAKEHRPWTDRTGHARQRLTCDVTKQSSIYKLTLSHGVDYGIWLELANEKRFAIIQPTILANSNDIMSGFENLLERLG